MVNCVPVSDTARVLAYLRKDVLRNLGLLESIERNAPIVPRRVWETAGEDGVVTDVMVAQQFPHGTVIDVQTDNSDSLHVMLECLEAGKRLNFVVQDHLQNQFLQCVGDRVEGAG